MAISFMSVRYVTSTMAFSLVSLGLVTVKSMSPYIRLIDVIRLSSALKPTNQDLFE